VTTATPRGAVAAPAASGKRQPEGRERSPWRDLLLLNAALVAVLALFLGKAFTIDDPLFLWLAEHLQHDPVDFFGFSLNWYGTEMPMHEVTKNPPLAGYFIALAALLVGRSEVGLHAAFLLPACGVAVGTYLLARRLCSRPLEASLAVLLTPAFLVSSTNVMADTLLLAWWCAAVYCWIDGLECGCWRRQLAAGLLVACAALTKFFGVALIPLLLLYGVLRERRLGGWLAFLALPVAALLAYEALTQTWYGSGMLFEATRYASGKKVDPNLLRQAFLGLTYAGGCLLPAVCFAPLLWSRRALWISAALLALAALFGPRVGAILADGSEPSAFVAAQAVLLALGGASVLGLALGEVRRDRSPESWLLVAWLLGTFVFASFLNWANNGRANLPMAPALGILLLRRLERPRKPALRAGAWPRRLAWAAAAALALVITYADYRWANGVRDAAAELSRDYAGDERVTYFAGHWGFQYYMERGGARPLDLLRDTVEPGQLLIVPTNNADLPLPPERSARLVEEKLVFAPWVATVAPAMAANFYVSKDVLMPFAFGRGAVDGYQVWEGRSSFRYFGPSRAMRAREPRINQAPPPTRLPERG
jgi:4-amino-4-deoxy-L-arabinose transferase-like glycosyltransferase